MFGFMKSAAVRELEQIVFEIQSNLENNYKDAAQNARVRLKERLEALQEQGKLREKEYRRFAILYTQYTAKMIGYHH